MLTTVGYAMSAAIAVAITLMGVRYLLVLGRPPPGSGSPGASGLAAKIPPGCPSRASAISPWRP
jgi:hypothetical protein